MEPDHAVMAQPRLQHQPRISHVSLVRRCWGGPSALVTTLVHIFQFAHGDDHCIAHPMYPFSRGSPHRCLKFPKQPDTLSQICSTWRRTALATSSLWSHIDLVIDYSRNRNILARARVYAQRAGPHPLEIHICDPDSGRKEENWLTNQSDISPGAYEDPHGFKFLDADTVSIRSLILDICTFGHSRRAHLSALEYFLAKCAAGALIHYTIRAISLESHLFVETAENSQSSTQTNILQLPRSQLEEQWRSVKILHITSFCPRWSSKLYHGLVDLRLGHGIPIITELQVVEILKASPGLRILHLRNRIFPQVLRNTVFARVQLSELEVLNIEDWQSHGFDKGEIVRWIEPGVKALKFTFFGVLTEIIAEFFKRSNATRFYFQGWELSPLAEILRMAPRLQTLVIDVSDREVDTIETLYSIDQDGSLTPTRVHVDTVYLLGFNKLALGDIQKLVDRYLVQRLFLWACDLAYPSGARVEVCHRMDKIKIREKLSEISNCPIVDYLTNNNSVDPDT